MGKAANSAPTRAAGTTKTARCALALAGVLITLALGAQPSAAWGPEGHRVIALFADHVLQQSDAAARAKLVALLATDTANSWTKTDIGSEATWADVLRQKSQEARTATEGWHYVRLKSDNADLQSACFGYPALPPGVPASHGPQDDCVVDKIEQFERELSDPQTGPTERLSALKFLLNLVGDIHEPLYAIDHGDEGGRCTAIIPANAKTPVRLLAYWDDTLVAQVAGKDPAKGAVQVATGLGPADAQKWANGKPADWALESFALAKSVAYALTPESAGKYSFPARKGETDSCGAVAPYRADSAYETKALATVKEQLAKAGMRLAMVLRDSLK
ncbi:MAG: S1/P1 Nuclease [Alphaproteobacteria bacterium]|nr:S1/P1 Nuclease [Alphaproteobacteria bacterium]